MADPDAGLEYKVKPDELDGCGQSAQHIGGLIPGETTKITEPSNQAAGTLQGWQTATAITNCGTNWKTLLDKLGGDMGDVGTKLATSAAYYRQAEQNAHNSMRNPNAPLPEVPDPFDTTVVPGPVKPADAKAAK
ncbi:WXG100 family type VII secretion target [Kitasatospora sp. NPDC056531]|uniref:WXG100 family type VII secretion target n=1 Tax=Kitasatospora sp. NPDC056531 TaxID=3345856 RepID=UPI00368E98D6